MLLKLWYCTTLLWLLIRHSSTKVLSFWPSSRPSRQGNWPYQNLYWLACDYGGHWRHDAIRRSRQLVPLWLAASFVPKDSYRCLVAHIQWHGHPVVCRAVVWIYVGSKRRISGPYFDAMPCFLAHSRQLVGPLQVLFRFWNLDHSRSVPANLVVGFEE